MTDRLTDPVRVVAWHAARIDPERVATMRRARQVRTWRAERAERAAR